MFWDNKYKKEKQVWGKNPSELGILTVQYLKSNNLVHKHLEILDIGCGYGRDAFYISKNIKCRILGIDSSNEAINLAKKDKSKDLEFRKCDFQDLVGTQFDIITCSNFYQVLKIDERFALCKTISKILKHNGVLFLSTLSVNDPEHYGKGKPIPEDPNSYQIGTYVHFCTKQELEQDFNFLEILNLFEHEFYEPRTTGDVHHHISWILIGKNKFR